MKKKSINNLSEGLRSEYDLEALFKNGQRRKYASRYKMGTNLVLLDSDVAKAFPNAEQVNEALRLVLRLTQIPSSKKTCSTLLKNIANHRLESTGAYGSPTLQP